MGSNSLLTSNSILAPHNWPFSLKCLPDSAYLVGGIVRDALLGCAGAPVQIDYIDLDFTLPTQAVETAQAIAQRYRAGFVLLDADRQIARVVFDRATADFAMQVGEDLEADLHRRDFTINAIAYSPHRDELFDPLGGYRDLQQHVLRMIAPENLKEDPLRLLRAYRQAAQLGFKLDPDTRATIQHYAPLIGQVAAERVQAEISHLLQLPNGTPWLHLAQVDGLLRIWFPGATETGLRQLAELDQTLVQLDLNHPEFGDRLRQPVRDRSNPDAAQSSHRTGLIKPSRRTWLAIAKLACLVSPEVSKAQAELGQLKYSRAEIQAVTTVLKCSPEIVAGDWNVDSRRDQYQLFQSTGTAFPTVALLALAHGRQDVWQLVQRFLDPDDPVAHPKLLLTGKDVMAELNLPPGPGIGKLLAHLQLAQAEGSVKTTEEARSWLHQHVSQPDEKTAPKGNAS